MMNIEGFITHLESQIDGIEEGSLSPETQYRELPQWDSLAALSLLVMVNDVFDVSLTGNELKSSTTVRDIYDLVAAKTK